MKNEIIFIKANTSVIEYFANETDGDEINYRQVAVIRYDEEEKEFPYVSNVITDLKGYSGKEVKFYLDIKKEKIDEIQKKLRCLPESSLFWSVLYSLSGNKELSEKSIDNFRRFFEKKIEIAQKLCEELK